jgi:hypothetical protein
MVPDPMPRQKSDELRRLAQEEVTPGLEAKAQEILETHADADYGTAVEFTLGGKQYRAVLEEHYNAPGEPGPEGYHKGVSLFSRE